MKSRSTIQRRVILEEIRKVYSHPTASEIHKMVLKRLPTIGIATIYRSLDHLEKQNLIIKLRSKDKEARYDGDISKHCHLICDKCGYIIDIFDARGISINSEKAKECGFKINLEHLEIHGLCKKCSVKINQI